MFDSIMPLDWLLQDKHYLPHALELHCGPLSLENHQATMFKLFHIRLVFAYHTSFEKAKPRLNSFLQLPTINIHVFTL